MTLVIVIAVVCFVGGVWAATRWLPDTAPEPLEPLTFFLVCGLFGAALCIFGVNVDYLVRSLESAPGGEVRIDVFTNLLVTTLRDSGTLVALALIALLMAPKPVRRERVADGGEGV